MRRPFWASSLAVVCLILAVLVLPTVASEKGLTTRGNPGFFDGVEFTALSDSAQTAYTAGVLDALFAVMSEVYALMDDGMSASDASVTTIYEVLEATTNVPSAATLGKMRDFFIAYLSAHPGEWWDGAGLILWRALSTATDADLVQPTTSMAGSYSSTSGTYYYGTSMQHWITRVEDGGALVVLEDGSRWQIDTIDRIDTMLWLPTEKVTVKQWAGKTYELTNLKRNKTAKAQYLGMSQ